MDSVPRKHCTLELGGNGAAVVLGDYASDADLDWAATRIATFSNYQGGQSCISVQRVIADASVYDRLRAEDRRRRRGAGHRRPVRRRDRCRPAGQRGRRQARRVLGRRGRAGAAPSCSPAASATAPPTRRPSWPTSRPTPRSPARRSSARCSPSQKVDGEAEAFAAVNDSKYGLQAGVFTHDLQTAFRAHRALEVGGVVVGDVPVLPRRPDAVRRRQAVRRRPRGRAVRDGRLHLRAGAGPDRPRAVTAARSARVRPGPTRPDRWTAAAVPWAVTPTGPGPALPAPAPGAGALRHPVSEAAASPVSGITSPVMPDLDGKRHGPLPSSCLRGSRGGPPGEAPGPCVQPARYAAPPERRRAESGPGPAPGGYVPLGREWPSVRPSPAASRGATRADRVTLTSSAVQRPTGPPALNSRSRGEVSPHDRTIHHAPSPSARHARSPRPPASRTGASRASPRSCSSAASGST